MRVSCNVPCANETGAVPGISSSAPVRPAYDLSLMPDCASVPTDPKNEKIKLCISIDRTVVTKQFSVFSKVNIESIYIIHKIMQFIT